MVFDGSDSSPDSESDPDRNEIPGPAPGTWAFTARLMAQEFPDFDWDSWKDQMKESDF